MRVHGIVWMSVFAGCGQEPEPVPEVADREQLLLAVGNDGEVCDHESKPESTDIFRSTGLFTTTVEQMSARDSSDTHEVIGMIFQAMNTPTKHEGKPDDRHRKAAGIRPWGTFFPM